MTETIDVTNPFYPIHPKHIDKKGVFTNSFGESSDVVILLLKHAQKMKFWCNFWKHDFLKSLEKHKNKHRRLEAEFKELIRLGDIVQKNQTYSFTHQFVVKCFLNSPAKKFC